ncbi:MAG: TraB/GumN family protein [Oscillospiraceae bacterium]|nr:TraB/GumN family protein [Oscillospiraceae bacterium]
MKRKIAVVFLVLCLLLTACTPLSGKEDEVQSTATPLLYKVSDETGNVLWLFGSIHVGREDYYPLPEYVLTAFDGSDALAVEMDIMAFEWNFPLQTQLLQKLMYLDGSTVQSHLQPETYRRAVEILEENESYSESFAYYKPVFWWSTIESLCMKKTGAQTALGIDRHLLKRARNDGKPVREVESAEFQYGMMAEFSEELQIELLESSIALYDDWEASAADLQQMMDLWAGGDEAAFAAYLNTEVEYADEEEAALYAEYHDKLIVQRNATMTEYAEEALLSGEEIFICVGAAHIVGQGAIAENLRELGYTVEIVTAES